MKKLLLSLLCLSPSFAAVTIQNSGITLGEPRVYHSHKSDTKVELSVVRLGVRSDKEVIISFNVPGHELHKKSFVYSEKCETTKCKKIFFTQKGGSMINLIANDGYWANTIKALLPGESRKIPLYYDEELSKRKSRTAIFNDYISDIYRDHTLTESTLLLEKSIQVFNKTCNGHATLKTNISFFKQKNLSNLLGMGKPMLTQIANTCKDPMYKEMLQMIQKISFEPSASYQKMILTKMNELIIYLSPDLHNPSVTAKYALDEL